MTISDGGGFGCHRPSVVLQRRVVGGLPVNLDSLMDHLKVDDPDEEEETVVGMALAACAFIERRTGWVLLPTAYEALMPDVWTGGLLVYRGPLRDDPVLSVQTDRGVWAEVAPADIWAAPQGRQFTVRQVSGAAPTPRPWQDDDCVRLTFECGFDAADETGGDRPIDDGLRMLLMMVTGHYYQNREMLGAGSAKNGLQAIELGADSLLGAYRQFW
nr:hypothetical protein [Brevundimonas naejangsanensis]